VNDESTAENTLGTDQLDQAVGLGASSIALGISLEVAKVTDVTDGVGGSTVGLAVGVDYRRLVRDTDIASIPRVGRTVGAGGGAAVGVVTELVDVEATLGVGVVASDVPGDGGGVTLRSLLEGDSAGDLGVSADDSDWLMLAEYS
jgi:hypothetical protein